MTVIENGGVQKFALVPGGTVTAANQTLMVSTLLEEEEDMQSAALSGIRLEDTITE